MDATTYPVALEIDHPTRVLLADVSGAGRRAISALLRSLPDTVLVAEVGSADELALERPRTAPDVVLIDDRLFAAASPSLDGADVSVIVMGLDDDPSFARRAHHLGATAWIAKEHADELLPAALDRARRHVFSAPTWPESAA
jgi:DNA-binding NarL/FixJ family response regulator